MHLIYKVNEQWIIMNNVFNFFNFSVGIDIMILITGTLNTDK